MVKFFDINANADADADKDEQKSKSDGAEKEIEPEHTKPAKQHDEKMVVEKPETSAKDKDESEPLRPDFSVADGEEKADHPSKSTEEHREADTDKDDDEPPKAPDIPRATAAMAPHEPSDHAPISHSTFGNVSSGRKTRYVTAILSTILIILLALLVSQAVIYFTQTKKDATSTTSADTTAVAKKTDTAAATTTPSTASTTTPSTAPVATTASTALTKETATVRVLNGGGVAGAAAKVAAILKAAGYTISSTANAKSYTYATTQVLYKNSDAKAVADDIAAQLKSYSVTEKEDSVTPASATEIVVIVGKK